MKIAKERIIFDNYSPWETYPDEDIIEQLVENNGYEREDITDDDIYETRNLFMEDDWDIEQENLTNFFKGKTVLFSGAVGRWDGIYRGYDVGEFWKLFYEYTRDCGYWRLYDENGHFYITCSHHDGTCHYEVRVLTEKGEDYLERCDYNYRRPNGNQVLKFSNLPRFAEKVYGCKPREYKESTKAGIINKLNNEAKSFYS